MPRRTNAGVFSTNDAAIDTRLRGEVETLLRHHAGLRDYLERPAVDLQTTGALTPLSAIAEAAGTVIGPYKLLEQIGEGGMGVVYMAEQTHPCAARWP